MTEPHNMRRPYGLGSLSAEEAGGDPSLLFARWFEEASEAAASDSSLREANAMALATATPGGVPSVRTVLLKGFDADACEFTWFTGRDSRKAGELLANPVAALVWWWPALERQVRATGAVRELPRGEVEAYFATRPREAQRGAIASRQSHPTPSRADLERRATAADGAIATHEDLSVPEHWTGFALDATELEFWQGREGRLHDRIAFRRTGLLASSDAGAFADGEWSAVATMVVDREGRRWLRARLDP